MIYRRLIHLHFWDKVQDMEFWKRKFYDAREVCFLYWDLASFQLAVGRVAVEQAWVPIYF